MTNWEIHEKKHGGGKGKKGWREFPAISIGKTNVSINALAMEAWLETANQVIICFAKGERKIGIKPIPVDEEVPEAYRLQKKETMVGVLTVKEIQIRFPDAIGHCYRAHMNGRGTIIEIELSPENQIR